MKIGIYSPYLDTLGGGERYILTIAEQLSGKYQVELLLDSHLATLDIDQLKGKIKQRLNLNLAAVKAVKAPLGRGSNFFKRLSFFKSYDFLFCVTDGSLFYSSAKNSFLHIQTPLASFDSDNPWFSFKQRSWKKVLYNSKFTKDHVEKFLKILGVVIYPPVDVEEIVPTAKKKQILNVGRFFGFLKTKKHEVMIDAFKTLDEGHQAQGWSLHLVGSAGEGDMDYVAELKRRAKGSPISVYPNLPFSALTSLYAQSSIYWHAAGFGESDPVKMEHFGISTVEAMAGGCVPVVINLGGQKEIIEDGMSGWLWDSVEQLQAKTSLVINNKALREKMSLEARNRSKLFGKQEFVRKINALIV